MTNETTALTSRSPVQKGASPNPGRVALRQAFCGAQNLLDRAPGARAVLSCLAKIHGGMVLLRSVVIRWTERRLSVRRLYRIFMPAAFVHAAFPLFKRMPPTAGLPDCFGTGKDVPAKRSSRAFSYLNRTLEYFPERLTTVKWSNRCRIVGLEHLQEARRGGRPVVLAFCHFGEISLLESWLHAAGFPVAVLVGTTSTSPSKHRRLNDRISPLVEFPIMFFLDQLRQVNDFLAAGNSLLIAIDTNFGKQISVPVRDGWVFQMASGPIRLAARHRAELISCSIMDEGPWRFRIELGRPVPRAYLAAEPDLSRAGQHLLEEMCVHFQACPENCPRSLIHRFSKPNSAS